MFLNNSVSCPRCGGMAAVADAATDSTGRLHFLQQARSVLTQPAISRDDLNRLVDALTRAQKTNAAPAAVAAAVAAVKPELKPLAEMLRPKDAAHIAAYLTLLLELIKVLLPLLTGAKEAAPQQQVVINHPTIVITTPAQATQTVAESPTTDLPVTQIRPSRAGAKHKGWRNARCRCGSGRRYSDCCGAER